MQQIRPETEMVNVRGTNVELCAMGGPRALDWAEMQVLCGRQKAEAMEFARRCSENDLRKAIKLLLTADYALLEMAGVPSELICLLSDGEKRQIIDLQDGLNRMEMAAPWLAVDHQAAAAYLGA